MHRKIKVYNFIEDGMLYEEKGNLVSIGEFRLFAKLEEFITACSSRIQILNSWRNCSVSSIFFVPRDPSFKKMSLIEAFSLC